MARLMTMLYNVGNMEVLREALPHHTLDRFEFGDPIGSDIDMVVADYSHLSNHRDVLSGYRHQDGAVLRPILLLLRERQLHRVRELLGELIDDVVCTPVRTTELVARINNLLRLGNLSRRQQRDYLDSQQVFRQVDRAYRVLADCNEAIIRASHYDELLEGVLANIVDPEGYVLAWVGRVDPSGRHIEIDAIRSAIEDPAGRGQSLETEPTILGPALKAMRAGDMAIWRRPGDLPNDDGSTLADRHGIQAAMAFPLDLYDSGRIMVIYSRDFQVFQRNEITLLRRLAEGAAHGIEALEIRRRLDEERQQAEQQAYRDQLTGLPNRQWVMEELTRLEAEAARHPRFAALLFLDLDGFKRINDTQGHAVGDRILAMVATRLRELGRDEDFVARLGGDEFVFVLQGEGPPEEGKGCEEAVQHLVQAASQLADRLITGMQEAFLDGGQEHHLGMSIGISLFPNDTQQAGYLVNLADMAMYEAKAKGGNQYHFYHSALTITRRDRFLLEHALHQALENGELVAHYQPIVNLETGEVEVIEALMRWYRKDGTIRAPIEFLGALEETGLIVQAGEALSRQAGRVLRQCRKIQPSLRLSLNLSPNQLWLPGLLEQISEMLAVENLPPEAVILEITEDVMGRDSEYVQRLLQQMQERGHPVAIDDFGAGYSSLSRLKELPVAMLKLDKTFLDDLADDSRSAELIRSLSQLAEALDLKLVVEGVETRAQWHSLQRLSCRMGQGYYFGAPMNQNELLSFLREQAAKAHQVAEN
ncbi:EAL domain-containing protein [Marinobacteraceae bacterium S3BR75-40.1]